MRQLLVGERVRSAAAYVCRCRSFGTAESIEGAWFLKTGDLIPISAQAFMDCSWGYGNNACDGGEAFRFPRPRLRSS